MADFSSVRIGTARLDLRPLADGDAEALFAIHSNPDFMRYWSSPPWASIALAFEMIARDRAAMACGEYLRLGIVRRDDARLIGACTLFKLDLQCRRAELGYGIAADCWRQGVMAEAVRALLDFGFGTMRLNRVEADIDPRNEPSARSLEALGFVREGFLRERWIVGSEVSDSALYGLLARDWKPQGSMPVEASARIDHVALWTADLDRCQQFYMRYFGANAGARYCNPAKGFESVFLSLADGARIEAMRTSTLAPLAIAPGAQRMGLTHLAIALGSEARVDALTARLRNDGFPVLDGPRRTGDGYYESVVLDPDGNRIEVSA